MAAFKIPKENGDNGGRAALSQIVIEAEGLGDPGAALCLRVDTQLVASNLTAVQMKFLICELLDRIEGPQELRSVEPTPALTPRH
jgi:hypothetical protein